MGDRIVVMLDGVIQQVDTPLAIYNRPANLFVATFIGSPPMNVLRGRIAARAAGLAFETAAGDFQVHLPPDYEAALAAYTDKPVLLGIRPEDLEENEGQAPVPGRTMEARIDVVEPMGSEIYLYLDLAGQPVTARINARATPAVDTTHLLDVNTRNLHFFDPETERALR